MHKSVERLDAKLQKLKADRAALVMKLQLDCKHELLAECAHKLNEWQDPLPPLRVCERCGMSEEGWSFNYRVLTGERTRKVSREELYGLRAGLAISGEHQSALLRGKVAISDLIQAAAAASSR